MSNMFTGQSQPVGSEGSLEFTGQGAINHLKAAVPSRNLFTVLVRDQRWRVRHPSPPFKFLDIGTKIKLYEVEGLTPCPDRSSVHHPRSTERAQHLTRFMKRCIQSPV